MKQLLLFICIAFISVTAFSQSKKNESFYLFDKEKNPVGDIKMAHTFLHVFKKNDSTWQHDYYHLFGPKITEENYKDEEGKIPNGYFAYYNEKGYMDSCGYVLNGRKHGDWMYFLADSGKVIFNKAYSYGILKKVTDYSIKDNKIEDSNVVKMVEIESEFPGGIGAWGRFLNKNLTYPKRAIDADIQGTVWVLFVVDRVGKVSDIGITKSVEYSIDEESIRVIEKTESWIPASQDGRKVKSYKRQPITYRLE